MIHRRMFCSAALVVAATLTNAFPSSRAVTSSDTQRAAATKLVLQVQRADYEGDRAALKRLHQELLPFVENSDFGLKVQYWRGFALWRRAINGFNEGIARPELQADLQEALAEFSAAAKQQPSFVDAKVGAIGCLSLIGYILIENGGQMQDADVQRAWADIRQLRKESEALDPQNPRLLWVMGPNVWRSPPERGGGEQKALEMYETGLAVIRKQKSATVDPLEPSWGEPELLMNLAYLYLHRSKPDLDAAERNAEAAVKLVPYWHYVRDILLPQIRDAAKAQKKSQK